MIDCFSFFFIVFHLLSSFFVLSSLSPSVLLSFRSVFWFQLPSFYAVLSHVLCGSMCIVSSFACSLFVRFYVLIKDAVLWSSSYHAVLSIERFVVQIQAHSQLSYDDYTDRTLSAGR